MVGLYILYFYAPANSESNSLVGGKNALNTDDAGWEEPSA
jgi:hypothetical protein